MDESEAQIIADVRALARGPFAEQAEPHDREGTFVRENVEALRKLGLAGMGLPKRIGGLALSAEAQVRVIEEIAYGDGSTAVAFNMHLFATEVVAMLPPFARREAVLADVAHNGAFVCGPVSIPASELDNRLSGVAISDGGDAWVLNGSVGFASMSEGATYVMAMGANVKSNGTPPDIGLMMPAIATPGIELLHNWDAMGFRGTASHDVRFTDVRVPKDEALVVPLPMLRMVVEAAAANPAVAASRARGALGICGIWLGLAQAAFDFTIDYAGKRHGQIAGSSTSLVGSSVMRSAEPWAQMGIGEMDHWLETGRIVLYDMVRRLETPFATTQEFNRCMVRTLYHCRRMSEEVSAGAMRVCGAHAYVRSRPLERIFRDMVGSNVMAWKTDQLRQTLGMGALGMPIIVGGPSPA